MLAISVCDFQETLQNIKTHTKYIHIITIYKLGVNVIIATTI